MFMKNTTRRLVAFVLFLTLLAPAASWAHPIPTDQQSRRALLLSYVLREYLSNYHYSHKPFDDKLSKAAFALYLKNLDFQKKFLLTGDVDRLQAFSTQIDNEMKDGDIELPQVARAVLRKRIVFIQKELPALFTEPFDFSKQDYLELDPKKIDFCKNEQELRARWHRLLKFQIGKRFLNLLADKGMAKTPVAEIKAGLRQSLMKEARQKVQKSNEEYLKQLLERTDKEYFINNFFEAVAESFDPHTMYMPPLFKEDFDIHMRGSLEGIGARLREEDGYVKVESVIPGSAAYRQGQLRAEDIILKVAQGNKEPVNITDMSLRRAVSLIRGRKGTEVRLTVRKPDGTQVVIPIIRDVVQIEATFVKSAIIPGPHGKGTYGYIKIPSFYRDFQNKNGRNVTDDTRKALRRLAARQVDGIIVDLRNDGGGSLKDAVMTAGLFINKGPIVQVRDSNGKIRTLSDTQKGSEYHGPVVVLVNRLSASASEIVAGALQDYGRAVIVGGDHTHGKGTVQAVIDLDHGLPFKNLEKFKPLGALKITTEKFYRITGASTQDRGVVPDIILPDWFSGMETGEKYLPHALPWDTIPPVPFTRWPGAITNRALLNLKKESKERVAKSAEFKKIEKQIKLLKAKRKKTRESLRLAAMQKEQEQAKADSKLFSRMHEDSESELENQKEADLSPKAKKKKFRHELEEDPYVKESLYVLKDLSRAMEGMVASRDHQQAEEATP